MLLKQYECVDEAVAKVGQNCTVVEALNLGNQVAYKVNQQH